MYTATVATPGTPAIPIDANIVISIVENTNSGVIVICPADAITTITIVGNIPAQPQAPIVVARVGITSADSSEIPASVAVSIDTGNVPNED
jgi:hypothetical protein